MLSMIACGVLLPLVCVAKTLHGQHCQSVAGSANVLHGRQLLQMRSLESHGRNTGFAPLTWPGASTPANTGESPSCCKMSELSSARDRSDDRKSLADMHMQRGFFEGREYGIIEPSGTCSEAMPCSLVLLLHGIGERGPLRPHYGPRFYVWILSDRSVCSSCYRTLQSVIVMPMLTGSETQWSSELVRDVAVPLTKHILAVKHSVLNPDRVYCAGYSVGGTGALLAAFHGADFFSHIAASVPVDLKAIESRVDWTMVGGQKLRGVHLALGGQDDIGDSREELANFLAETELAEAVPVDVHEYSHHGHYVWTAFDNLNMPWLWEGHAYTPNASIGTLQTQSADLSRVPELESIPDHRSRAIASGVCIVVGSLVSLPQGPEVPATPCVAPRPAGFSHSRLQDIELMRAFLCLLIVWAHLYENRHDYAVLKHKEHFVWNFVMVSGFITHKVHGAAIVWESAKELLSFYRQRLVRVILSYQIACALSFALMLETMSASGVAKLWGQTWWTFAMLQSWVVPFTVAPVGALNLPLWTINGLVFCWLLYPFLSCCFFFLRQTAGTRGGEQMARARWRFAVACVLAYMLALCTPRAPWGRQFFPPWCVPPFACGMLVCELLRDVEVPQMPMLCSMRPGLVSVVLIIASAQMEQRQVLAKTWQLPLVAIVFLAAAVGEHQDAPKDSVEASSSSVLQGLLASKDSWFSRLLTFLGAIGSLSLAVYVLHFPLALLVGHWCKIGGWMCSSIPGPVEGLPQFTRFGLLAFLVLLLVASYVQTHWVERALMRWCSSW